MVLKPRSKWDESHPSDATQRDWYPWRYNRRLLVLRRPIVQLSEGQNPIVLIAPVLLDIAFRYLLGAADGDLPAELFDSPPMVSWIGAAVNEQGHKFNHVVADKLATFGWRATPEVQITSMGGSAQLGDVDVMCWSETTGVVIAIECKRLSFARTTGEIGERLAEYTRMDDRGARTPIKKHLDRVEVLRLNDNKVAKFLDIKTKIKIKSALVTDILVPMQFSTQMKNLVDVVTNYRMLDQTLSSEESYKL